MKFKQYKGYLFGEWREKVLNHMETLGYNKPSRGDWKLFLFKENGTVDGDTSIYAFPRFIHADNFQELTPEQFLKLKKSDVTIQDKKIDNDIYTCPIHKISWNKNDYDKDCPLCVSYSFVKYNPSIEWLQGNLVKGDIVFFKTKYNEEFKICEEEGGRVLEIGINRYRLSSSDFKIESGWYSFDIIKSVIKFIK